MNSQMADGLKMIAPSIVDMIPGGAIFVITDTHEITFTESSRKFDVPGISAGTKLRKGGGPLQAIEQRRKTEEKIPRSVYGSRVVIISEPIIDQDIVQGVWGFVMPILHPLAKAFPDMAPVMTAMFKEGAFLYMTDLQKVMFCQGSPKFNIPEWQVGTLLTNDTIAKMVIKSKQMMALELDATRYGVPIVVTCYPCFDEEDSTQIVGTFGIILPRKKEADLRDISNYLNKSLEEMSAVLQEIAASATEISMNEGELYQGIKDISHLSEDINGVLRFIKQIADETKMLGLNAAIEAARAGEVGKGFGVVAEEIRKLSDESKTTVGKIRYLTDSIKQNVNETVRKCEAMLQSSEEQAAASEEMSARVQEISDMSARLMEIAKEI